MSKDAGCLVETKTGRIGRTYHRDKSINKKTVVHTIDENGKEIKLLCDPKSLKIIEYVD